MKKQRKRKLRGPELLCAAVKQITVHPETWDQTVYHCGSTHCIAGHCELLGGVQADDSHNTHESARLLLKLSETNAIYLFDCWRTLAEIRHFAETYRLGYNRGGYDRDGYDRDGYNRDGYNRDGYNRDGRNRYGYI